MSERPALIAARNVTIIALLALLLAFVPGGGNLAEAILTALSLIFLAAIALLAGRFWQQSSLTRDVMSERQRRILYGSLGALALMIAGIDEMFRSGPGTAAWLAIVGVSVYLLIDTWRQAASY